MKREAAAEEPRVPDARSSAARGGFWISAAYAAYYMALGFFWPYYVLYYRQIGLSGAEIGILAALPPLGQAVLAPAWGIAADVYGAHRLVLRAALGGAAIATVLMTQAASFATLLPLIALLALCIAPTNPLLDTFGVTISEQQGVSYGRLRVWGSAGFMLTAWLSGRLMGGEVSRLFLGGYAAGLLLCLAATLGLPPVRLQAVKWRWSDAARVAHRPAMLVVLLTVVLVSSSMSTMFNFFGLYLAELGGGTEIVGVANAVGALSELPVMAFGGWLVLRLGSRRLLALAIVVFCSRFLLYTVLPSADWVLPVQLLHGLSFAAYLMAGVMLVHEIAGSDLAATAQGLLGSAFAGGQIIGSLAGGALLDRIGVIAVYRLAAGVLLLALIVLIAGLHRFGTTTVPSRSISEARAS